MQQHGSPVHGGRGRRVRPGEAGELRPSARVRNHLGDQTYPKGARLPTLQKCHPP